MAQDSAPVNSPTGPVDGFKTGEPEPPRKPKRRPIRRAIVRPTPRLLRAAMRYLAPSRPR